MSPPLPCLSPSVLQKSQKYPNAANADVKDIKEGKEGKEGQDVKEGYKDTKDTELSRSVSVMSTLSYRKRSNLKDSIGGTGDESSLFSTLKEQPDTPDRSSLRKAKNKCNEKTGDDLDDRGSVISQAYSEATSRARKGLERRWTKNSQEFDKESVVSSVAPSRTSMRRGLDQDDDANSIVSGYSVRRSMSWMDDGRSECGSAVSPGLSRRSGGRSPGSISISSRTSLARSSRLSEFGVNLTDKDDAMSVAFSEGGISPYSPRSLARSHSSPAQSRAAGNEALDETDIKPVTHRNYLDPDLEKAINEVLSFKPIKFKRRSLEDTDEEKGGPGEEEDDRKSIRSLKSSLKAGDDDDDDIDLRLNTSRLQRSASGSALDYTRSSSSFSSRSRSSSRKAKKKNRGSRSESSSPDERRKSSKKKGKKESRKGKKKKESESESSESDSSESSSSSSSGVSYRSSNSIKKGPGRGAPVPDEDAGLDAEDRPLSRKEERKKKKKMDNLVMKYLYRPDSD